jgi:hypothetical protein
VTRWILQRMAIDGMSVKACARALGIGWDKTNQLALTACRHLAYGDPTRLDRVRVLGVDEHKWKHVPKSFMGRWVPRVRHRHRRPDPTDRRGRPGPTAGHGARPVG